ncbi:MAG TPA: GNAT family N-acetyltransferase [Thermoanaerobaculia bacterium]|nr:GNAT family N-acetyltransferase [Thermoanaerobaculia bacterium]
MIDIRPIRRAEEFRAVEQLQQEIWNVVDREVVPTLHLIPATAVGAILLGAFDGERLVGFVYGFPGFEGEARIIHSDMLAVLPDYRGAGLGRRLKMAQRQAALDAGVRRITWTFDPLQARNAHLNFNRFGVTSKRYLRDFYGDTTSPLHRGIGTDRLWVEWNLSESSGLGPRGSETIRIEIPADVGALPVEEARAWREKTRDEFEKAFARGFIATRFERGTPAGAYILTAH